MEIRAAQNASDAFDELVCARLGINGSDHRCLDILERHGRMTAGELGEASGLTSGAITTLLDRLERSGYVRRIRDTQDRRKVLVEMTEEAYRAIAEFYRPLAEGARAQLERYTEEELELILEFHRQGRELNERLMTQLRNVGPASRKE